MGWKQWRLDGERECIVWPLSQLIVRPVRAGKPEKMCLLYNKL